MRYLDLAIDDVRRCFPEKAFTVKHNLSDNPLFELPRLIALSQTLPDDQVEYNSGKLPVSQDPAKTPRNGLSVKDTIQRIEECDSWLVLKNVEADPEYRALLDACLDEVDQLTRSRVGRQSLRESFIFISSPRSVTPYHMDPEHNFLLQIRGQKTVHMFDAKDRSLLSLTELESFHSGGHRNLVFRDEYQARATSFALEPGQGVHSPVTAPHWVQNGPAVSISYSTTFRSALSIREARLHILNAKLRKLHLEPTPPGESAWRDAVKYGALRCALSTKHLLSGGTKPDAGRNYARQ